MGMKKNLLLGHEPFPKVNKSVVQDDNSEDICTSSEQLRNLLNSRSFRYTRPFRYLMSAFIQIRKSLNSKSRYIRNHSIDLQMVVLLPFLMFFSIAGWRALRQKVFVVTSEDFVVANNCLKKSLFVRVAISSDDSSVTLHLLEDIFFGRLQVLRFLYFWNKFGDNSTLYVDVLATDSDVPFVKPAWDSIYHASFSILSPIYLESNTKCNLTPRKVPVVVKFPTLEAQLKQIHPREVPTLISVDVSSPDYFPQPFSVVIPTANKRIKEGSDEKWLIKNLIEAINSTNRLNLPEIIVVHNQDMNIKDQNTLSKFKNVRLVLYRGKNLNISKKINLGVKSASNELLILSNDDVELISQYSLSNLLRWLKLESVGVVGPKIFYPNGTLQYAGIDLHQGIPQILGYRKPGNTRGVGFAFILPREVRAVTGVMMATKKTLFNSINGWDEQFAINFNDVDYCLRIAELGKKVVFDPSSQIFHLESASRDLSIPHEEELKMFIEKYRSIKPLWPELYRRNQIDTSISFLSLLRRQPTAK
jgi:GT2 family glycosyltransferase